MELNKADVVINKIEVPLKSYSADPKTGKVYEDAGVIQFVETVVAYEGWYFGIIESEMFQITFFNYYPVNGNPGMRTAYAAPNYYQVRNWITNVVDSVSRQLLSSHPQATLYKPDGTPELEPSKEIMEAAWELFKQARSAEIMVDKTPDNQETEKTISKGDNKK